MKAIQIFLLVLIVLGLGLTFTQKFWVTPLVTRIVNVEMGTKLTRFDHLTLNTSPTGKLQAGKAGGLNTYINASNHISFTYPFEWTMSDTDLSKAGSVHIQERRDLKPYSSEALLPGQTTYGFQLVSATSSSPEIYFPSGSSVATTTVYGKEGFALTTQNDRQSYLFFLPSKIQYLLLTVTGKPIDQSGVAQVLSSLSLK